MYESKATNKYKQTQDDLGDVVCGTVSLYIKY